MAGHSFYLPADFNDYELEVTAKGFFSEAKILYFERTYSVSFYDPARLAQEIENEIQRGAIFFEMNLIVIQSVTGSAMAQATDLLVRSGRMKFLLPNQSDDSQGNKNTMTGVP